MRIGFIGQGWVGKHYADAIEARGFDTVRYGLEEPYAANKDAISICDIVFIAVPTPTTPQGFIADAVRESLSLVGAGKIAVIKSTILPGLTKKFQAMFPDRIILFAPEFLREATAAHDAAHPYSSFVGVPSSDAEHLRAADKVLKVLPSAPFSQVCDSTEAELVKYIQNALGYADIVMFNLFYDLAQKLEVRWEPIRLALAADPNIASRFANPVHKGGRGAGGHCLIKDFAAIRSVYRDLLSEDRVGNEVLKTIEQKNLELLLGTNKSAEVVAMVYGEHPEVH